MSIFQVAIAPTSTDEHDLLHAKVKPDDMLADDNGQIDQWIFTRRKFAFVDDPDPKKVVRRKTHTSSSPSFVTLIFGCHRDPYERPTGLEIMAGLRGFLSLHVEDLEKGMDRVCLPSPTPR
ncbi:hypothetical protein JAAARDRAFT_198099 [Jaapia argillacea MUCL 33604]|uniref:Uncharacterized protein n=1 Tax=Jaapia argillacea MUCL 33604 TaxID=933084 RepID=A0A067PR26_9AGAM|nr:hypothetical protein JAAARDRAFT_198099 [Jaapia argillacea MUCL 33604]